MSDSLHIINSLNVRRVFSFDKVLKKAPDKVLKEIVVAYFPKYQYWGGFKEEETLEQWINRWKNLEEKDTFIKPKFFQETTSTLKFIEFIDTLKTNKKKAVYIWCSGSLEDQLFLIWVITILIKINVKPNTISIKYLTTYKYDETLNLNNFYYNSSKADWNDLNYYLNRSTANYILEAWSVLQSLDPVRLIHFLNNHTYWFSFLHHKLKILLSFFPNEKTGITIFESLLFREIDNESSIILDTSLVEKMVNYKMNSEVLYLWYLNKIYSLSQLSNTKYPVFNIKENFIEESPYGIEIKLTNFGMELQHGFLNNLDYNNYHVKALYVPFINDANGMWCLNNKTNDSLIQIKNE